MTKDRRADGREDTGVPAVGRGGDGNGYRDGARNRPLVSVAVMPLWDRPRPGACR